MTSPGKKIALVLSGGGARGAYEVGIIHYIRTMLPPPISKKRQFDILCGSSIGAINSCFLAATSHNLEYQGNQLHQVWKLVQQDKIYRRGMGSLTHFLKKTITGVGRNLFSRSSQVMDSNPASKHHFRGLLDTTPFAPFLREMIPWKQIQLNIEHGLTQAVSVTTTNIHSGRLELFIHKRASVPYSGRHPAHFVTLEDRHALASAAIPVLFPAVRIDKDYYCDGGMRLNTPMSPAIHLGADKLLVIGLHHRSERAESKSREKIAAYDIPPTLGEVLGVFLKSVFVDRLDYDLEQLKRINRLVEWGRAVYGSDFIEKINAHVAMNEPRATTDIGARGLKTLEVLSIFPSVDIRAMFRDCVMEPSFIKQNLSYFEKLLLKILDVDLSHGYDFLSFILFVPTYLQRMIELGFEDAKARHDDLVAFFEG